MKRVVLVAVATGALAACGGNSAPNLRSFNYGAPQTPNSTQQATADMAQISFSSISGAPTQGAQSAVGATSMTDTLAGGLSAAILAGPTETLTRETQASAQAAREGTLRMIRSSALQVDPTCTVITSTSVTYNNCSYNADGFAGSLSGHLTISGGSITWDIKTTFSGNTQGVSFDGSLAWNGQITVTDTTIKGLGRSALVLHASGNGQSANLGRAAGTDFDLTYSSNPFCVTGGTLEVRVVQEASGSGTSGQSMAAGLKFTWSGCNSVMVAQGT